MGENIGPMPINLVSKKQRDAKLYFGLLTGNNVPRRSCRHKRTSTLLLMDQCFRLLLRWCGQF